LNDQILHVSASYKPAYVYGGPTISISTLCEKLLASGQSLEVATTTANGKEDFSYKDGERVIIDQVPVNYFKRLTGDNSHLSPGLFKFLYKNLNTYSLVHIHTWWNMVSMGSAFICWLKSKPYVLSPRGTLGLYSFSNRSGFLKRMFHYVLGKRILEFGIYQVSSNKEADDIRKIVPNARISVIPNFLNLPSVNDRIEPYDNKGVLKLLFFSRIEQKKGLIFLLEALLKLNFEFILNIYGEGDSEYINSLKQSVPLTSRRNVIWHNAVYGNSKFDILSEHDLLILPSFDENFANVVIESLHVGTAVLITKKVGVSDYVEENNFGWICEQSGENISKFLNLISKQRLELNRIKKAAPLKVAEDFDVNTLTKKYRNFYSSVLDTV
jgi:glycosyltransferase involved in cell wall biosynthesis